MRISEDLRKCVAFVGHDIAGPDGKPDIDPVGTAFFVTWSGRFGMDGEEVPGIYLVTARHVARVLGESFVIRFNNKTDGSDIQHIDKAQWHFLESRFEDVAVLHCGFPDWSDCKPIPGHMFVTPFDDRSAERQNRFGADEVGSGDLTSVLGLFKILHGKKRNLIVIHTGNIALLPQDEKIPVKDQVTGETYEASGYLVEAHTLPGLSGAPVFVRGSFTAPITPDVPPYLPRDQKMGQKLARLHTVLGFLGLWRSSWEGDPSDVLARERNLAAVRVPVGFGLVVPAYKVAEALNMPDLVAARRAEYKRRRASGAMTEDAARPTTDRVDSEANPSHREDFRTLVGAAAKKKPQAD